MAKDIGKKRKERARKVKAKKLKNKNKIIEQKVIPDSIPQEEEKSAVRANGTVTRKTD